MERRLRMYDINPKERRVEQLLHQHTENDAIRYIPFLSALEQSVEQVRLSRFNKVPQVGARSGQSLVRVRAVREQTLTCAGAAFAGRAGGDGQAAG